MFPDTGNLPVAGGALLGAVIYTAFSLFVTGPLVGERMIDRSDWTQVCVRQVTIEAERREPPPRMPSLTCEKTIGVIYGTEGERFCRRHGDVFRLPFGDVIDEFQKQKREFQQSLVARAAAQAPDRCSCAAASVVENRRVDFALHTGSLRFVTPTPIKNLRAELSAALRSPVCAANAKE